MVFLDSMFNNYWNQKIKDWNKNPYVESATIYAICIIIGLLILLIILLCSGGGWWFRWRHHANFRTRSSTPQGRRRHGRGHNRGPRVYPHTYYTPGNGNSCNLPPGYDKDPPSYNEVISHLSQFPTPEARYGNGDSSRTNDGLVLQPSAPDSNVLAVPPPTYQMVLDLKRRESQLDQEIADEEAQEEGEISTQGMRSKIQTLLGRTRRKGTTAEDPSSSTNDSTTNTSSMPPPVGSFPPPLSSPSSSSSAASSGLFTISRESLPPVEYYNQNMDPPQRCIPSPSDSSRSSSHSDYSSSFLSSPSSMSRSPSASPPHSPPSYAQSTATPALSVSRPPTSQSPEGSGNEEGPPRSAAQRPCTGRSTLARPTTSISTRSLPPPEEATRKTSLPGALAEMEGEEMDQNDT